MGIIKAVNLIFDYIRHDEEEIRTRLTMRCGESRSISRKEALWRSWGITVPENRRLPS